MTRPPLYQELYLICHGEDGRAWPHLPSLALGMAGAVLVDLVLADRLYLADSQIIVYNRQAVGDPVADSLTNALAQERGNRHLLRWLKIIAADVYERGRGALVAGGLVTRVEKRRLGMLVQTRYQPTDIVPAVKAQAAVRYAIHGHQPPDPQCAALCGLVGALRLYETLDLEIPPKRAAERVRQIMAQQARPLPEIISAVDALVGELAVAVYR